MLHCLRSPEDFAALGRAEAMKWLHQPQQFQLPPFHSKPLGFSQSSQIADDFTSAFREIPDRSMKAEHSWDHNLPGLAFELPEIAGGGSLDADHSLLRTSSCPLPELGASTSVYGMESSGRTGSKKRKAEVRLLRLEYSDFQFS